ncbi:MAG: SLAP domain-containing protein [Lactobacillus panisapium]|nr:SLAP domain-containing protein [Lactobacillus panisapium]
MALTGVGATSIIKENTYTASANHQGTRVWVQYGTLKYALKGPSGRVYPAGTKVARRAYNDTIPASSLPNEPFYLTLIIGGLPGANNLTDADGGAIAESYVNIGTWNEQDYPSNSVALVNNTMDNTDLKSSDFHPVDSSNPDVPHANVDELNKVYADLVMIGQHNSVKGADKKVVYSLTDRYMKAKGIGVTQAEVDQLVADINTAIANYKRTGHLTDSGTTAGKPANSNTTTAKKPTTVNVSKSRYVKLRKASYCYNHKGKRVSKKLLKKGSIIRINGKVYRIKGKTYYRIAKNRYVRVVNVAK